MRSLKVTILTNMLSDGRGVGEWGFAALVEADERRILFDTGARPDTIVINSQELGMNLNGIPDVIRSHNHGDHTTGLVTLRDQLRDARIHTGKGVFYSRRVLRLNEVSQFPPRRQKGSIISVSGFSPETFGFRLRNRRRKRAKRLK